MIVAAVAAPLLWPKQSPSAEPVPTPIPEPVEIAPKPIKAVEPLAMKLPLHQAEVLASKEKEPAPVPAPQPAPVVIVAIPKDAMVMKRIR